jgi:hypothetical protein
MTTTVAEAAEAAVEVHGQREKAEKRSPCSSY